MPLDTLDTVLTSIHPVTPRVKQFVLEAPDHTFDHRPGQHVSVAFRDDGDLVVRPYSPVSRPGSSRIALAVKRYPEGTCSTWMHEREVGDTVSLMDPSGNLHLRDLDRDAVFLSTGTGITPMIAMLKALLDDGTGQATVVVGERTQDDLLYRETLDQLSADHSRLSVHYVLSDEDWDGRTGYVQDHLGDVVRNAPHAHVFLCGVPEMVVETRSHLQSDLSVPKDHIFVEGWEDGAVE